MNSETQPWIGSRVIPLVVVNRAEDISKTMDALLEGGINVIEIGLRTPQALRAIELACKHGGMRVGAGTVTSRELASSALAAGAEFGVSPSAPAAVVGFALEHSWPYIPGFATVTEANELHLVGFEHIKMYPADLLGAEKFARALNSVLPKIKLMPSGGVSESNLAGYLKEPNVFAISGSWIASTALIQDGDFFEITRRARQAVQNANANG